MKTILKPSAKTSLPPLGTKWLAFLGLPCSLHLSLATVFWKGLIITQPDEPCALGLGPLISRPLRRGGWRLQFVRDRLVYSGSNAMNRSPAPPPSLASTGYRVAAMMALLLDIGRPDRFWKSFVFWNTSPYFGK
ncbi:MAG: hypothetical protein IPJ47_22890 [Anaerolineales bacterium]|nr:hypothetical protein [Anaerolineales bacterium]